jgi:hypothetical protein
MMLLAKPRHRSAPWGDMRPLVAAGEMADVAG